MTAQGVALLLGRSVVLGCGGEEGGPELGPVFGSTKHFDRFPDRRWLGGEVDCGHQQAPPVCSGLTKGRVELAGCVSEVGFG